MMQLVMIPIGRYKNLTLVVGIDKPVPRVNVSLFGNTWLQDEMNRVTKKPDFGVSVLVRNKPGCTTTRWLEA